MTRPLDWAIALKNVEDSEELLLELAQVFVETCPDMMMEICQAIDSGNAGDLNRAAHNLKGAARVFAAGPVVEHALQLEEMGAAGDLRGADEKYAGLEPQVTELTLALTERLERARTGQNNRT